MFYRLNVEKQILKKTRIQSRRYCEKRNAENVEKIPAEEKIWNFFGLGKRSSDESLDFIGDKQPGNLINKMIFRMSYYSFFFFFFFSNSEI